jgi:hypothetical protein
VTKSSSRKVSLASGAMRVRRGSPYFWAIFDQPQDLVGIGQQVLQESNAGGDFFVLILDLLAL